MPATPPATPPAGDASRAGLRRRLGGRRAVLLVAALLLIEWAATGIRAVREDEQGVVLRFGAVAHVAPPGILFTLPWPIERTRKVRTTEVRTMPIGYKLVDAVRGIAPAPREVEWVSGDTNIIDLTLTVKYVIADPVAYLFPVGPIEADFLVRRACETIMTRLIATLPVDEILTHGKIRIQEETRLATQAALDDLGAGLRLVTINLNEIVPPANVIDAFNAVATAKLEKARMLNQADGYRKDLLPRARAMANRTTQDAQSYRAGTLSRARGDSARFVQLLAEVRQARAISETRLYLEAMERILPRARKLIVDPDSGHRVRLIE